MIPLNVSTQGISNPPCGRSAEYLLGPVTLHVMVPPRCKNDEQIEEILLGTWPTTTSDLQMATANKS